MRERLASTKLAVWLRRRPIFGGLLLAACVVLVFLAFSIFVAPATPMLTSEAVITQAIASGAVVLAATLPAIVSTRRHAQSADANAAVVREEVKNNHKTNFREDTDRHRDEIIGAVKALATRVDQGFARVEDNVTEIRSDIRGLRRDGGRRDDRLMRLEDAMFDATKGKTESESEALGSIADTVTKRTGFTPVQDAVIDRPQEGQA